MSLLKQAEVGGWTATDNAVANSAAAGQAQTDAAKWLVPVLAAGGTVGALSGLYRAHQQRQRANKLQAELNYPTPTVPLGMEKSASLEGIAGFLAGNNAHSYGPLAVPWFLPAAVASAYGGHYLGNKATEGLANRNLESDTEEDLNKVKQKYLQAVKPPAAPAVPDVIQPVVGKAAADNYTAPFFSMDKWGPELGAGVGAVGGMSLLGALSGYQKARAKTEQEKEAEKQKALDAGVNALMPQQPGRLPAPVSFS